MFERRKGVISPEHRFIVHDDASERQQRRLSGDEWKTHKLSKLTCRAAFVLFVIWSAAIGLLVTASIYNAPPPPAAEGTSLVMVREDSDKGGSAVMPPETPLHRGGSSEEHHEDLKSQYTRILPPDGKMNALLLVPNDFTETPPEFDSYNWVVIREGDLPENSMQQATRHLHRIFVRTQPVLVVSVGSFDAWQDRGVAFMPRGFRQLWRHFNDITSITESTLTASMLRQGTSIADYPLISIITSTFRSGDKLWRAYESLKAQTYDNWEWVLWDDSPEQDTYEMLQELAANDLRLRVFKAPQRSGYIGEMKLRAGSLASGAWILELDHDDRMPSELLGWVRDIAVTYPSTKFIYSDGVELNEADDGPTSYGDYYGYFYGSYYRQYLRAYPQGPLQPQFVSRAAWLNPLTIHHLVGLPNHVRIWNKAFYHDIGGHRKDLNVADDYDLLVRTFLAAQPGEIVCITAAGYFQYRNSGGNNFTVKRNALIQHLVKYLYEMYEQKLLAKYRALGWPATVPWPAAGIWERPDIADVAPRMEMYYVPEDQDAGAPCISVIVPTQLIKETEQRVRTLQRIVEKVVRQTYGNWKVYLIGNHDEALDQFALEVLPSSFEDYLDKIHWYNLGRSDEDEGRTAIAYATRMIVKTRWYLVFDPEQEDAWDDSYLAGVVDGCLVDRKGRRCLLEAGQELLDV